MFHYAQRPVNVFSNVIIILASIALIFFLNSTASADEATETYDGIIVEQAFVQTNQGIPNSQLRLKISNLTSSDLTLTAISTEWFEEVKIMVRMPGKGLVEANTLSILQEETLELDTSHLVIELSNLKRAIKNGDKIEFELFFANQTVPVFADIHSSKS